MSELRFLAALVPLHRTPSSSPATWGSVVMLASACEVATANRALAGSLEARHLPLPERLGLWECARPSIVINCGGAGPTVLLACLDLRTEGLSHDTIALASRKEAATRPFRMSTTSGGRFLQCSRT